jgi:hypothetical protein
MKIIKMLGEPNSIRALVHLRYNGYLRERGWFEAYRASAPVGRNNEPLPWMTYPFISFIEERLNKNFVLFEYGSGNSTIYFSGRVKSVSSIEHDKTWFETVKNKIPQNVDLAYKELVPGGEYSRAVLSSGVKYDIIVVDGRDRVNCLTHSMNGLKEEGIIVLDDAQREEYGIGIQLLLKNGFKRLSFWGISPGNAEEKATDIFYRPSNCLNI